MRGLGALNLSIGTSLALEKDAFLAVKGTGSGNKGADSFLVNLRTIVRNVIEAYSEDNEATVDNVIKDTKSDLGELAKWLNDVSGTRTLSFIVYYPSYKSLPSLFNKADLVTDKTRKPKAQDKINLIEKVCTTLCKQFGKQITQTDSTLPNFTGKGIVITHHTVDLTLTPSVTRLNLLESYTGTIKPYTQWYTKLTGGKALYYMPFNKLTIQVFGDKATNFYSSSMPLKKLIEELAQTKHWNSATSYSKVKSDINSLPQSITKAGLKLLI